MWISSKAKHYGALAEPSKGRLQGLTEPVGQLTSMLALKERKERSFSVKIRKK